MSRPIPTPRESGTDDDLPSDADVWFRLTDSEGQPAYAPVGEIEIGHDRDSWGNWHANADGKLLITPTTPDGYTKWAFERMEPVTRETVIEEVFGGD